MYSNIRANPFQEDARPEIDDVRARYCPNDSQASMLDSRLRAGLDSSVEALWKQMESFMQNMQERQQYQFADLQHKVKAVPVLEQRIDRMESFILQLSQKLVSVETELQESRTRIDQTQRPHTLPTTNLWKPVETSRVTSIEEASPQCVASQAWPDMDEVQLQLDKPFDKREINVQFDKPIDKRETNAPKMLHGFDFEVPNINSNLLESGISNLESDMSDIKIQQKDFELSDTSLSKRQGMPSQLEASRCLEDDECCDQGQASDDLVLGEDEVLNLMIRNVPCSCSRQDLLDAISELGFADEYNFFHMPCPGGVAGATHNLGYAFVGFHTKEATERFAAAITGYKFRGRRGRNSNKSCTVTPARVQGLQGTLDFCQQRKSNKNQPIFSM